MKGPTLTEPERAVAGQAQRTAPAVPGDLLATRGGTLAVAASLGVLFLGLRLAMLFAREPFFDELFTLWIVRRSFAGILQALRHDSGPPLYYFLVRALGIGSVTGARLLSLACASISFGTVLVSRRLGAARFTAAAFLALFPPAVLFAVDARAYALCAMFVTFGVLLIAGGRPLAAAPLLAMAAYSHYYGVLFFPLLLLPGEGEAHRRPSLAVRFAAAGLAGVLFLPGFALASRQPAEAVAWMGMPPHWPDALMARPGWLLLGLFLASLAVASARVNLFTGMTAGAVAVAGLFAVAGRPVYFPLRFEAVLAPPLALAAGISLARWKPGVRRLAGGVLLLCCAAVTYRGIVDHARREPDEYGAAARWAALRLPAADPLVASGYLYLESLSHGRAATAWPAEQAEHPGWRVPSRREAPPPPPFVWIGERDSLEYATLRRQLRVDPLYVNGRAVVARVTAR